MPSAEELFHLAHTGLPREAPGSPATTRLLLGLAGPLPDRPRVVDVGCGPGTSTLLLAELTGGDVLGVDTHPPFLEELRRRGGTGLDAPMQVLPLPDGSVDLLWAEGSAYVMGFDAALAAWRRLLAPGGVLVLTEAEWATPHPAPGARAFWDDAYPAMRTTAGNVAAAQDAGWTVAAAYLLPDADWDAYYGPLAARIAALRPSTPMRGPRWTRSAPRSPCAPSTAPTTATPATSCARARAEASRRGQRVSRARSRRARAAAGSASGARSRRTASSTALRRRPTSAARDASSACIDHRSTNTATLERSTQGSKGLVM